MIFNYEAVTSGGEETKGSLEAFSVDVAISQLQKRGLIIKEIKSPDEQKSKFFLALLFHRVSNKDIVILSRQMATLFQAQISTLRIFRLLGSQAENPTLQRYLLEIATQNYRMSESPAQTANAESKG